MILVVEDEPGVLQLCSRILERASYRVLTATNAEQAIDFLKSEKIRLLLADIRMPGVSGFQLMELAREEKPDLSVVLMTGYGTVDVAIEALNRGADGLILKPFDREELLRSIEKALQESQRRQDSLRLHALNPLFTTTKSFFSETHPLILFDLILDAVCNYLDGTFSAIYKEDGSKFVLLSSCGESPCPDIDEHLGSLLAKAALSNEGIWIDSKETQDSKSDILRAMNNSCPIRSLMCTPIRYQEGNLCLLTVRTDTKPSFQEADYEMLVILARQASAALDNASLYANLRESMDTLERSQKALLRAEKTAAAGRLTASIAHEINNPLQAVSNCLHLIGRNELNPESREKYLKLAQSELERLMNTVQRMLDLYRPAPSDQKWMDIEQMIQKVLLLLDHQLEANRIKTTLIKRPDVPLMRAVPDHIQQVLINLLINSIEAMPQGGEILIEVAGDQHCIEVNIGDTGPGIPDAELEHIFEPFVSNKENGTGLGLAVSLAIVQAHQGSLEYLPDRNVGASFRMVLPVGGTS